MEATQSSRQVSDHFLLVFSPSRKTTQTSVDVSEAVREVQLSCYTALSWDKGGTTPGFGPGHSVKTQRAEMPAECLLTAHPWKTLSLKSSDVVHST